MQPISIISTPHAPSPAPLGPPSHLPLSTSCLSGVTFKLPKCTWVWATQWDGEPPSGHSPKEK